jgi:hypothetical protein
MLKVVPVYCTDFDLKTCHVVPALIKRVLSDENPFIVWGTSDVVRDFLYVKDVVKACLLVLEKGESMRPYNIGSGSAITIGDIVNSILKNTNKTPEVIFDSTKPTTIPFRMVSTERLKNEFGSRFGLYGGGWDKNENNFSLSILPHMNQTQNNYIKYADGNISSYAEEGKAYRSCKIAINLSHFEYSRYSSDRMFRILGSGAFCLTHRFPDIEKDFKIDEEVVVWENLDDLCNKIRHYLTNEKERQIIATNGCDLARDKYTWDSFAENLKLIINKYE